MAERVAQLQAGKVPIYEHHLGKILDAARRSAKISFTADAGEAIVAATPSSICRSERIADTKENGDADLSAIDNVARQIATEARSPKLVIEKAPFPLALASNCAGP